MKGIDRSIYEISVFYPFSYFTSFSDHDFSSFMNSTKEAGLRRNGILSQIERLQRRAARIIYFKAASNLSTDQIMTKLGLEPLYYRRRTHILRFVDECIANRVPRYLSNYFNVRNRDIHRHKTRNNNDLILERINLECTKRAFFYKGAKIFNNF